MRATLGALAGLGLPRLWSSPPPSAPPRSPCSSPAQLSPTPIPPNARPTSRRWNRSSETNQDASDRSLKGVRKLVKDEKLAQAASRFSKAAAALEMAERQLAPGPRPPADAAKLGNWLAGIKGEVALMRRIATTTSNQVIAFDYCKTDPAAYT